MSFHKPCHMPFRKLIPPFTLTGFGRPYQYFSITLKVILAVSDRYNIFTNDWLWIIMKFVKTQFLVKSISLWQQQTKNFEIHKIQILCTENLTPGV